MIGSCVLSSYLCVFDFWNRNLFAHGDDTLSVTLFAAFAHTKLALRSLLWLNYFKCFCLFQLAR